jgi:hypothetical protein
VPGRLHVVEPGDLLADLLASGNPTIAARCTTASTPSK